jgi:hypothetical protein
MVELEDGVDAVGLPWMESEPLAGAGGEVRVSWIVHSDAWRDGGRRGQHRGPCGQDSGHAILWHLCSGTVDLAGAETEDGAAYPRWVPSACPEGGLDGGVEVAWKKCCGLRWRAS